MKKSIIIAVIIVLAGVGVYVYTRNQAQAPTDTAGKGGLSQPSDVQQGSNPAPAAASPSGQTTTNTNPKGADYTPPTSDTGGEAPAPNIQVVAVDYDGSQFSPSSVNIKVNDWVFFKNKGTGDFWPASNPHPTHTDYPGFDALKPIAPGGEYKFQFTKVGDWGFHDHLNPGAHGTVHVSQ